MRILTLTVLICLIGQAASCLAQEAPAARTSDEWRWPACDSGTQRAPVRRSVDGTVGRPGELVDYRLASAAPRPDSDIVLADAAPAVTEANGAARDEAWVSEGTQATSAQKVEDDGLKPAGQKPWEVRFIVYGWIPGFDGHAGPGANPPSLDVNYCDVLDSIDLIECMVPVDLEVRYGPVGVFADLFYVKLEDQVRRDLISINLVGKQTILEVGGFYRVGIWPLDSQSSSAITADVLGGARYNRLEGAIGLQAPERAISIDRAREWWDPFLGPRLIWQVTEQFSLRARGDVGGFGIENCSHFVWQINAAAEYAITRNILIEVGYRLLDTDYETDSGPDHFTYDVLMQGPYIALGVKF